MARKRYESLSSGETLAPRRGHVEEIDLHLLRHKFLPPDVDIDPAPNNAESISSVLKDFHAQYERKLSDTDQP